MGIADISVYRAGGHAGGLALVAATLLLVAPASGAAALSLSPLNGTPDASPQTQISFLGVPAKDIEDVSVVGSLSGRHGGRLEAYASAPGASFLPGRPFAQGERVTASALVGPRGHAERVSTTFTVARLSGYRAAAGKPLRLSKPGLVQSFVSEPDLKPPTVQVTVDSAQAAPGDVFLTPTHGYGDSGEMILNGQGGLVWFRPVPAGETAADLQVQSYEGRPVLTWWQGEVPPTLGVGFGTDEIYGAAYTPVATVSAGNGYRADLHELQITPEGSAFITAYSLVDADLSSVGGSREGVLQDAILQEVDIKTGLVMFEWHAYGHVGLSDSYSDAPSSAGQPWDYFHINSVSLDPWGDGNFVISARNTWAAYEIDHASGAVLWRLGGKHSSFRMGPGTGTAYQHDVRWQSDGTLTLFDDGAAPRVHSQSRAITEHIDWKRKTVELVGRYVHSAPPILSGSQGNDQALPNGDSFVGWGEVAYLTEFDPAGQIVFDAHFPFPGQSYRSYRFAWSATPAAPPSVAARASGAATTVYASWNGATGVSGWTVLGGASATSLSPLLTEASSGFETTIAVGSADAYFAVQAVGANGEVLRASAAVKR